MTDSDLMITGARSNMVHLITQLRNYLNMYQDVEDINTHLEDISGTVVRTAHNIGANGEICQAAMNIQEHGVIGRASFGDMIYKNGVCNYDRGDL